MRRVLLRAAWCATVVVSGCASRPAAETPSVGAPEVATAPEPSSADLCERLEDGKHSAVSWLAARRAEDGGWRAVPPSDEAEAWPEETVEVNAWVGLLGTVAARWTRLPCARALAREATDRLQAGIDDDGYLGRSTTRIRDVQALALWVLADQYRLEGGDALRADVLRATGLLEWMTLNSSHDEPGRCFACSAVADLYTIAAFRSVAWAGLGTRGEAMMLARERVVRNVQWYRDVTAGGAEAWKCPHEVRWCSPGIGFAAAAAALRFAGTDDADPALRLAEDRCLADRPVWDVESGEIDFRRWLFGTWAMLRRTEPDEGRDRWMSSTNKAVIDHGAFDLDDRPPWSPEDAWSRRLGPVASTAVCELITVCYYLDMQRVWSRPGPMTPRSH